MAKYEHINKYLDDMAKGMSTTDLTSGGLLESAEEFGSKIKTFFDDQMKDVTEKAKEKYIQLQADMGANPDKYKVILSDAYNNEMLRIGANDDAFAPYDNYSYGGENLYNWMLSISMYMTSWVFRNIIDQQAADIVGYGFKLTTSVDDKKIRILTKEDGILESKDRLVPAVSSEDVSKIYEHYDEMTPELIDLVSWGKMFGGAAALVLDSGLDPSEYYKDVEETGFYGEPRLFVADRWNKMSTSSENVSNVADEDFGTPIYYNFYLPDGSMCVAHHSRVLRYANKKGPSIIQQMLQGWGIPELQHLFQELNRNEKIKNTITSLLSKWNLEILKIQGMRQFMQGSLSERAAQELDQKLEIINRYRSFNSLIFLDKNDEYIREDGSSMTGLSEILKNQKSEVTGAAKMPMVLLYGDQEKGLSGNTKDDMQLYDKRIQAEKNGEYRKAIRKLIRILSIKYDFDKSFKFKIKFNSIIEPTLAEKVTNSSTILGVYQTLKTMKLYDDGMIARELKSFDDQVIFGQELTDDVIQNLSDNPTPEENLEDPGMMDVDFTEDGVPDIDVTPETPEPEMAPSPSEQANVDSGEVFSDIDVDNL